MMRQLSVTEAASLEQKRIDAIQQEKALKLRRFQDDLRKRVNTLTKKKVAIQQENSYRAFEVEKNVLYKSAESAAEQMIPRRDSCNVRKGTGLSIKLPGAVTTATMSNIDPRDGRGTSHVDDSAFRVQTNKVRNSQQTARQNLASLRIQVNQEGLPGAPWGISPTRDLPVSRCRTDESGLTEEGGLSSDDEDDEQSSKHVHFKLSPDYIDRLKQQDQQAVEEDQLRRRLLLSLRPGVQAEESRKQHQTQVTTYRRLFMDIEREQVREKQRQKEHKKRIEKLKASKEYERQMIEEQLKIDKLRVGQTAAGERNDGAGEVVFKITNTHQTFPTEDERRAARLIELERYITALKANMKEKLAQRNLTIPPLCRCAPTFWETDCNTCANNCVFYRNPKAFAKALSSVLQTCDILGPN